MSKTYFYADLNPAYPSHHALKYGVFRAANEINPRLLVEQHTTLRGAETAAKKWDRTAKVNQKEAQ